MDEQIDKDIEFLKAITHINEDYPTTNPWRETIPVVKAIAILERYKGWN